MIVFIIKGGVSLQVFETPSSEADKMVYSSSVLEFG